MFATQEKIDAAPDNEVRELAEKLWYLRQDFSGIAKEPNLLPTVSNHFFGKGFPDDTKVSKSDDTGKFPSNISAKT